MNADDVLIEDHNQLRGLLGRLKSTTTDDSELRRELLDQLVAVLTVHVQIEDELFYPAIAEVSTLLGTSHAQHRQIDDQLAVVLRTDPATDDFAVELDMLASTLEHHAGEEEELMFFQAQALGAARFGDARRAYGAPTSATSRLPAEHDQDPGETGDAAPPSLTNVTDNRVASARRDPAVLCDGRLAVRRGAPAHARRLGEPVRGPAERGRACARCAPRRKRHWTTPFSDTASRSGSPNCARRSRARMSPGTAWTSTPTTW